MLSPTAGDHCYSVAATQLFFNLQFKILNQHKKDQSLMQNSSSGSSQTDVMPHCHTGAALSSSTVTGVSTRLQNASHKHTTISSDTAGSKAKLPVKIVVEIISRAGRDLLLGTPLACPGGLLAESGIWCAQCRPCILCESNTALFCCEAVL